MLLLTAEEWPSCPKVALLGSRAQGHRQSSECARGMWVTTSNREKGKRTPPIPKKEERTQCKAVTQGRASWAQQPSSPALGKGVRAVRRADARERRADPAVRRSLGTAPSFCRAGSRSLSVWDKNALNSEH